jgi:hypothetical protein
MATQKEMIEGLIAEVKRLKSDLPNGNIVNIEKSVDSIQKDMKEIKRTILNPESGIIVRVNKNTEWREEREEKIPFYDNKVVQFSNVLEWKRTVSKALWVLYSALVGLLIKILFF